MKLKNSLSLLLAVAIATPFVAEAQTFTSSAEVGYASRYVFRGIKRENSNIEASARLNFENFYGTIWTMQPFATHTRAEYNYSLGYQTKFAQTRSEDLIGLDVGVNFYDYANAKHLPFRMRDSIEAYVGFTMPIATNLAASLYAYYDFRLEAVTTEGSIGYQIPLNSLPASINLSGFAGYTDANNFQAYSGRRAADSYSYYGLSAEVPYRIDERLTVTAGVQWGDNVGLKGGQTYSDTTNSLWWSAKIGYRF